MPAPEFRFSAFTPVERRIIADALKRHAEALDDLYENALAAHGTEAARIQVDAIIARNLYVSFAA